MQNEILTHKNVLITSLRIFLSDFLAFLGAWYGLWQVFFYLRTESAENVIFSYSWMSVFFLAICFILISGLSLGLFIRIDSTCVGHRKPIIDCLYLGVGRSIRLIKAIVVSLVPALFYGSIIYFIGFLNNYSELVNLCPKFFSFINNHYNTLLYKGSAFLIALNVFKNPFVFIFSILEESEKGVFEVIEIAKKAFKGKFIAIYQYILIPILLLFFMNILFNFYETKMIWFINYLLFVGSFVLSIVYYQLHLFAKDL